MEITKCPIEGLYILEPQCHADERGYFMESFRADEFTRLTGVEPHFVQENESLSRRGVVRGLHYQLPPYAQAKLVRVVRGEVWDVAVDLRRSSPTFGEHLAVRLSAENRRQLYIPEGFAHGFVALSEEAVLQYKCSEYYHPEAEGGVAWDDATLAIEWPIAAEDVMLSAKDRQHPALVAAKCFE